MSGEKMFTLPFAVSHTQGEPEPVNGDRRVPGKLVRAGSPEARFFYLPTGAEIPMADAIEAGFVEEPKKAAKPADKKRTPAQNKSS